jgi:hypothetical protein
MKTPEYRAVTMPPIPIDFDGSKKQIHATYWQESARKSCEENNLMSDHFALIFSDRINFKRRHAMFSGLVLGLGLAIVGLVVYFLHKEHGPDKAHH